ncbi:hypothetical protein Z948_2317 [Sulfitobacter donghicola DSW-25 = KCTC 12864 = JCM 14565]|uniref:Uncharacterized protein n=1 Tax=Sulfitobacter donghicola DSW-25 = KCTC 12864 = JCM 14565 TaxID=1300350 RepID=A0A073IHA2_9RHOB|nr:hypothetical protein DSW25_14200 [Sulfitobacter donghicola DSW-25 = KCTC 12864 = JCM 14565]KIN68586.1 hypothetical protein Z948_2317 [Sulfitobacter donghicola DSW-25 = KCTC 12864 = JCM 14565]
MIEATTNPAARAAMNFAHAERGRMIAAMVSWLSGGARR